MTGVTRNQLGRAKMILQISSWYFAADYYCINPARTLKAAATKNAMRLGTAQFCYIGSRIGWVSELQSGEKC